MVIIVEIDVEFVVRAVEDAELVSDVLAECAGHESLFGIKVGVGVVGWEGVGLVD